MAKKRRRKKKNDIPIKNLLGLAYILIGVLGFFAPGFLGILVANMIRFFIGDLSSVFFVILAVYGIYLLFTGKDLDLTPYKQQWLGFGLLSAGLLINSEINFANFAHVDSKFLSITINALQRAMIEVTANNEVGGGILGALLYSITHFALAEVGSFLLAILLITLGIIIFLGIPMSKILGKISAMIEEFIKWLSPLLKNVFQSIGSWISTTISNLKENRTKQNHPETTKKVAKDEKKIVSDSSSSNTQRPEPVIVDGTSGVEHTAEPIIEVATHKMNVERTSDLKSVKPTDGSGFVSQTLTNPNYQLPPSTLLTAMPQTDQSGEYKLIKQNTKLLQETLNSFGVKATVESVKLGPSVTEYELHPAIGVKVSKIVGLSDDLALALAAKDIRIEAPIPGKSLIGIEVPNQKVSPVSFRDIIEAQPEHQDAPLQVPIGRDVSGNLITADLVKMQHLLIAGATGSGKSVMINVIITSLLMNAKPDEVKLILIDPKKVELGVYNDIPHLLTPVVTDARKAAKALHKVVAEMQHRYDLFAEKNQRNIAGYNDYVEQENKKGEKLARLPYIVVIVDELADLMMVASNEVEDAIIRLAQLARAAGIHMIIATQRPSVDVVTGLIKANVPSRIAFAVASGTDSRTIIDSNGAEKLLGRGDMLYFPMGESKPERVQGAFISDADVKKVIDFIKNQQTAEYDAELTVTDAEAAEDEQATEVDEYYNEAVELVTDMQKASTSMLQRKFRIGYNRAARLIDQLEENEVIGPQEGSKPRKVYRNKIE